MPGFVTRPMPVEDAARAVVDGIERREARICAPWWVGPMLTARGFATTLMDEAMLSSSGLSETIARAERQAQEGHEPRHDGPKGR